MIKAALNGARAPGEHPALPLTPAQLAAAAAAAVAAGAGALHVHPRDADGAETLAPADVDAACAAIHAACPGVPLGVSTGEWIEADPAVRARLVASWAEPDFASVNLTERGHRDVMEALERAGIGIEAGIWVAEGVDALVASGFAGRLVRVLVEPQDADPGAAVARALSIDDALDAAGIDAPRVLHGRGPATWAVLEAALSRGRDIRAGLEDALTLPDGSSAPDNAALVRAAVALG